ncbi:metal ABC transporter ATP-binding protein [Salisediminibacterium halotolerans]|uniref:metal ABC transporter ATP-binding protein n=1 Tax=Salisediminibacterium halotolerans TaxID=517425 RepID=UPI000EB0CBFE|nr:metal ABC transporter ATP-binding protein [Salisediminibacterium halotolerans]RLJ78134.1 iron/zinc/copper transport system ATP-binding protein [Actinophytocola xinjiangensis]RPE88527.1 iron/zinc/copper transport system ATP-binding protein [Salisediminibacterium halotolerans]TWG37111.1 iron/zinc/copper transport system ATP-binding protein [Salisediminibacterium halotolerans]GEL07249.1 ABC transporter ATP-binding protein [Salisediminibacterium halotolerans]
MKDIGTVDVANLSVYYHKFSALQNISFSTAEGTIIGVIGPNGAGKSTLMKAMLNLEKSQGTTTFNGRPVSEVRKQIAYVPQRSEIDWDFPVRVEDVVLMGRYMHVPWYKKMSKQDRQTAYEALEKTGMEEFRNRQIGELSGGQQQRVFIARALAQDADYFFLDEPFVGIDMKSEQIIVSLLHDLRRQNKTIFVIHHDLSKVESYFDRLLLLNQRLIAYGTVSEVYKPENLKAAYGGSAAVLNDDSVVVVQS